MDHRESLGASWAVSCEEGIDSTETPVRAARARAGAGKGRL